MTDLDQVARPDPACPFCGDDDGFDIPGLAHHLRRYCEKYQEALDAFDNWHPSIRSQSDQEVNAK